MQEGDAVWVAAGVCACEGDVLFGLDFCRERMDGVGENLLG
jgi:hypothetical protein